jgi:hypothetical protein
VKARRTLGTKHDHSEARHRKKKKMSENAARARALRTCPPCLPARQEKQTLTLSRNAMMLRAAKSDWREEVIVLVDDAAHVVVQRLVVLLFLTPVTQG